MNQQDITNFIRHELRDKLRVDMQALRMVKEADVECSIYFHLRKFLGENSNWRLLARKHAPATGHYIDLILFKHDTPVIAIEIKWGKRRIPDKDRASLEKAIDNLKVQKAYWISMTLDESSQRAPERSTGDQYRLFQIVIPLGLTGEKKKEWINMRRKFRRDMKEGKNV